MNRDISIIFGFKKSSCLEIIIKRAIANITEIEEGLVISIKNNIRKISK